MPESINPGWKARAADGAALAPVTVNGWQQGWVLPPGTTGPVTLTFPLNAPYRAGLIGGLALLPLLALLAFLPVRRPSRADEPASPWHPGRTTTRVAVMAVAAAISGAVGVVVGAVALGLRFLLSKHQRLCDAITVGLAAGGLISAGAVLSQNPWRSVDGYAGHSAGVQLLALVSVVALAASTVAGGRRRSEHVVRAWSHPNSPESVCQAQVLGIVDGAGDQRDSVVGHRRLQGWQ